jgi:hypothetical protein
MLVMNELWQSVGDNDCTIFQTFILNQDNKI